MDKRQQGDGRRFVRFNASELGIDGRLCGRPGARLRDISVGGVSFHIDRPLKAGNMCEIDIEAGGMMHTVPGFVAWSRSGGIFSVGAGQYTVGVRFDHEFFCRASDLLCQVLDDKE